MESSEFVPIRVSTLRGDAKISFDTYVNISEKNILFCRKGDSFEGKRLDRLKKKNLKKMYILKEQEEAYRAYLTKNIEEAYDTKSSKPIEDRAAVIQGAQEAAGDELMEKPEDESNYNSTLKDCDKYLNFILEEEKAFATILSINNESNSLSQHGTNVGTLAIGIVKKLDLMEGPNVNLITLGCLLHDIEHIYSGLDLSVETKEYTENQLLLYNEHPKNGVERVRSLKHFHQFVVDIIYKHHETANGTGFPQKLKGKELDPTLSIISMANAYDSLVSFHKKTHSEALRSFYSNSVGLYSLEHLNTLKIVLKENALI